MSLHFHREAQCPEPRTRAPAGAADPEPWTPSSAELVPDLGPVCHPPGEERTPQDAPAPSGADS